VHNQPERRVGAFVRHWNHTVLKYFSIAHRISPQSGLPNRSTIASAGATVKLLFMAGHQAAPWDAGLAVNEADAAD
jgi:hypothetical protein